MLLALLPPALHSGDGHFVKYVHICLFMDFLVYYMGYAIIYNTVVCQKVKKNKKTVSHGKQWTTNMNKAFCDFYYELRATLKSASIEVVFLI